jgi:hypothetical protein
MEVSGMPSPLVESKPQESGGPLGNKRAFSSTRAGATFDMAYFLKNTGPSMPARETSKEDVARPGRRKNRNIFRKWREPPDLVIPAAEETSDPTIFVPPEGVEQKITARGV